MRARQGTAFTSVAEALLLSDAEALSCAAGSECRLPVVAVASAADVWLESLSLLHAAPTRAPRVRSASTRLISSSKIGRLIVPFIVERARRRVTGRLIDSQERVKSNEVRSQVIGGR
jgi:hypothetical protein